MVTGAAGVTENSKPVLVIAYWNLKFILVLVLGF
jgi:hypothetical protein